jgi:uncharacterized protein YndB with AHSA1/START domain
MNDDAVRTDAVVLSERIRATPDQVFEYLVEPDKLVRWMGVEAKIDPSPGGDFWLNVTGRDIAVGSYVEVDRPNRIVFTWGWEGNDEVPPGSSTVAFTLTAVGDETLVELVHSGLSESQNVEHTRGWAYFVDRLARAAAGDELEPQDLGADPA